MDAQRSNSSVARGDSPDGGEDLGRRARRGALWSIAGFGGGRILGVVSNPVLSYLLLPAVRGVMEWVNPFILGFELLSDLGIGPSIIQSRRGGDPAFLHTAFTIQVVRGLLLWLGVSLCAVPYAAIVGLPELATILPVAGSVAFINGLQSTKMYTASRELSLGALTGVELSAQVAGFVIKLVWAFISPTVWSLVMGSVLLSLVRTVTSHLLLPGPADRLRWHPALAREMVRFGRWIFISTLLTFLTGYADRWIFGAMIPLAVLGLYGNAAILASLPTEALGQLAIQVVFPLYSRVVQQGRALGPVFRSARLPLQVLGGWALSGLIAGGPTAMRLLYDPRWWGSGWMIQVLAAGLWLFVCEATNGAALLARGEPRWVAAGSAAKLAAMCVFIPVGHAVAGFPGALVAYAATETARYAVSAYAVHRAGLGSLRQDLALTVVVLAVGASVGWLAELTHSRGIPVLLEAAMVAALVTLAWAPIALGPLRQFRALRRQEPTLATAQ